MVVATVMVMVMVMAVAVAVAVAAVVAAPSLNCSSLSFVFSALDRLPVAREPDSMAPSR